MPADSPKAWRRLSVGSPRTPQADSFAGGQRWQCPSLALDVIMNKVVLEDIVGNAAYEKKREQSRQRIIEIKRRRRVSVGNQVTLVFENRDTVIFQIQEMMRAEKISDLDKIREE